MMTIVGIFCFVVVILIVLRLFYSYGYFGIYQELNIDRKNFYCWYRGNIVSSACFSYDDSKESIENKKKKCFEEAKENVKKIKKIRSI